MGRGRVTRLLLLGVATVAAGALAFGAIGAGAATKPLAGKKIGLEFCTDANPFCAAWIKAFKANMEKLGAQVTVLTSVFDPAKDAQNMAQLIAAKPNLIVITPADPNAIIPSLARAKAAGIPVINAIGRLTPAGTKLVAASVLTDNAALGNFAAQNVVQGMQKAGHMKGNVIALTGTATQLIVQDRVVAFKAAMAKFPQYKVVAIQDTNWDQATSAKVAQQLLAKYQAQGGIQGAYGMADNMAVGIVQGATQAGVPVGVAKKGLVVVGSNCLSVGIQAIKAGTMYGTASQAPLIEATAAAKAAQTLLTGGKLAATTFVHEERITAANVGAFTKVCTF